MNYEEDKRVEGGSMVKNKISKTILIILLFSLLLCNCSSLFTTPINKILEDPRNYTGKTVTVSGEVTRVFSLFIVKYFVIERQHRGDYYCDRKTPAKDRYENEGERNCEGSFFNR